MSALAVGGVGTSQAARCAHPARFPIPSLEATSPCASLLPVSGGDLPPPWDWCWEDWRR